MRLCLTANISAKMCNMNDNESSHHALIKPSANTLLKQQVQEQ